MARTTKPIVVACAAGLLVFAGVLSAQNSGLTRTVVTKADVSVPDREAVVALVEVAPGAMSGWHTHPGDEISYVNAGEATLMMVGPPPRKLATGDAFVIPAGVAHNVRNEGTAPFKLLGVYVVDKGKPLASPAPAPAQ